MLTFFLKIEEKTFAAEPDNTALLEERSASPSAFIKGPNVYRMGHAKHSKLPKSLSVKRIYNSQEKIKRLL